VRIFVLLVEAWLFAAIETCRKHFLQDRVGTLLALRITRNFEVPPPRSSGTSPIGARPRAREPYSRPTKPIPHEQKKGKSVLDGEVPIAAFELKNSLHALRTARRTPLPRGIASASRCLSLERQNDANEEKMSGSHGVRSSVLAASAVRAPWSFQLKVMSVTTWTKAHVPEIVLFAEEIRQAPQPTSNQLVSMTTAAVDGIRYVWEPS
jgi:hypothetical protein